MTTLSCVARLGGFVGIAAGVPLAARGRLGSSHGAVSPLSDVDGSSVQLAVSPCISDETPCPADSAACWTGSVACFTRSVTPLMICEACAS
jgi:hypothetical protein